MKREIIVVEPVGVHDSTRPDWVKINCLITRGFTRLYPINDDWVICAKQWVTQKRAMQLWDCICSARPISVNVLVDLLAMISLKVPPSVVANWGKETRYEVEKYCMDVHLRASDNIVRVPPKPRALLNKKIKTIGLTGPSVMDMGGAS
jgi:hypothetical protein